MGTFYNDEQIQEAIAALESNSPGIWERLKKMAALPPPEPPNEEQELEQSAIVRALTIVLPEVSFVAQAEDRNDERARLSIDLGQCCSCRSRRRKGCYLDCKCGNNRRGSKAEVQVI